MKSTMSSGLIAAGLLCLPLAFAWSANKVELNVGDPAPTFEAKDDTGGDWKSADHTGKKVVVVYFFPADFTGGCTKQACGFRDDMAKLSSKNVEVVGVSGDSVKTHQEFKKFHNLNFTLLADPDGKVAEQFGVPFVLGEKTAKATIDGKEEQFVRTATINRWTFVISKQGKVASKNDAVKAAEDSKAIMEVIEKLEKAK